ncbi:MAG TPA: putative zinc-binding protein [Verrucomicrobiae bacterium]|nr:putative zinc-binding protein [Verrucomicrobiae bacterium]
MNEEKVSTEVSATTAGKKPAIIYACSGCSDAGEIADRVARQLTREGDGQMSCLAGIGGRVKSLVMKAENAERILVVDGCPLNCAAHTLKLAGFQNFEHLELHKIGIRKGSCPVTDEKISAAVEAGRKILSNEPAAAKLAI